MKKYLYSMLLLAVAGMATTAFVSCEEKSEDVVEQKVEPKEDYVGFKYWLTNDVLEIADVTTTGIGTLKFTTDVAIQGVAGKACDLVELKGQQAKDAAFTLKVTLKSNWKELISKKESIAIGGKAICSNNSPSELESFGQTARVHIIDRETLGDQFESQVETYVNDLGYEYKK